MHLDVIGDGLRPPAIGIPVDDDVAVFIERNHFFDVDFSAGYRRTPTTSMVGITSCADAIPGHTVQVNNTALRSLWHAAIGFISVGRRRK